MVTKAVLALLVKYSTFLARKKKYPFLESTSKSTMTALKDYLSVLSVPSNLGEKRTNVFRTVILITLPFTVLIGQK